MKVYVLIENYGGVLTGVRVFSEWTKAKSTWEEETGVKWNEWTRYECNVSELNPDYDDDKYDIWLEEAIVEE